MKIKLLKDIPGFKAGEILEGLPSSVLYFTPIYASDKETTRPFSFPFDSLVESDWAEEVKEVTDTGFGSVDRNHTCSHPICKGEIYAELGNKMLCEYSNNNHVSSLSFKEASEIMRKVVETDEIDMEEVRDKFGLTWETNGIGPMLPILHKVSETEAKFFTAYRIIKHVIDTLNGDWKFDIENEDYYVPCVHSNGKLTTHNFICRSTILPSCKNQETAEKVISLCEPELKILFGVK